MPALLVKYIICFYIPDILGFLLVLSMCHTMLMFKGMPRSELNHGEIIKPVKKVYYANSVMQMK